MLSLLILLLFLVFYNRFQPPHETSITNSTHQMKNVERKKIRVIQQKEIQIKSQRYTKKKMQHISSYVLYKLLDF